MRNSLSKSTAAIPVLLCLFTGCTLGERAAVTRPYHVQVVDADGVTAEATIAPPSTFGRRGLSLRETDTNLVLHGSRTSIQAFLPFAFHSLGVSPGRLCIEAPLPDGPCRCTMQGGSKSACEKALCEILRKSLGLRAGREIRATDVYVLTAPSGSIRTRPQPRSTGESDTRKGDLVFPLEGATTAQLCYVLEYSLASPVLDESNVPGEFGFRMRVPWSVMADADALAALLQDRFGLCLTPAQRDVEVVVVRADRPASDD